MEGALGRTLHALSRFTAFLTARLAVLPLRLTHPEPFSSSLKITHITE